MTLKVLEYELFHVCPLKVSIISVCHLVGNIPCCSVSQTGSLFLQEIMSNISFAPIGLLDMFNASGAVEQIDLSMTPAADLFDGDVSSNVTDALGETRAPAATVVVTVRGCGRFGAYSSQRPLRCTLDAVETEFGYDAETGLLTVPIPVPEKEMYRWTMEVQV